MFLFNVSSFLQSQFCIQYFDFNFCSNQFIQGSASRAFTAWPSMPGPEAYPSGLDSRSPSDESSSPIAFGGSNHQQNNEFLQSQLALGGRRPSSTGSESGGEV